MRYKDILVEAIKDEIEPYMVDAIRSIEDLPESDKELILNADVNPSSLRAYLEFGKHEIDMGGLEIQDDDGQVFVSNRLNRLLNKMRDSVSKSDIILYLNFLGVLSGTSRNDELYTVLREKDDVGLKQVLNMKVPALNDKEFAFVMQYIDDEDRYIYSSAIDEAQRLCNGIINRLDGIHNNKSYKNLSKYRFDIADNQEGAMKSLYHYLLNNLIISPKYLGKLGSLKKKTYVSDIVKFIEENKNKYELFSVLSELDYIADIVKEVNKYEKITNEDGSAFRDVLPLLYFKDKVQSRPKTKLVKVLGKWFKAKNTDMYNDYLELVNLLNTNTKKDKKQFYLYISDRPDDKLRMATASVKRTCQNLHDGGHRRCLPSNLVDDMAVAYIISDKVMVDNAGKKHPYKIHSRCLLRLSSDGSGIVIHNEYNTLAVDWAKILQGYVTRYGWMNVKFQREGLFIKPAILNKLKQMPYLDDKERSIGFDSDKSSYSKLPIELLTKFLDKEGLKKYYDDLEDMRLMDYEDAIDYYEGEYGWLQDKIKTKNNVR